MGTFREYIQARSEDNEMAGNVAVADDFGEMVNFIDQMEGLVTEMDENISWRDGSMERQRDILKRMFALVGRDV